MHALGQPWVVNALAPLVDEGVFILLRARPVAVFGQVHVDAVAIDAGERCVEWEEVADWAATVTSIHSHHVHGIDSLFHLIIDGISLDTAITIDECLVASDQALSGIRVIRVNLKPLLHSIMLFKVFNVPCIVSLHLVR